MTSELQSIRLDDTSIVIKRVAMIAMFLVFLFFIFFVPPFAILALPLRLNHI
jgi:hypothetical protein